MPYTKRRGIASTQRSRSQGPPPLPQRRMVNTVANRQPLENTSNTLVSTQIQQTAPNNAQLIPYSPWRVILYKRPSGPVVLYNQDEDDIEVRRVMPQSHVITATTNLPSFSSSEDTTNSTTALSLSASSGTTADHRHDSFEIQQSSSLNGHACPTCFQPISDQLARMIWESQQQDTTLSDDNSSQNIVIDNEYFKLLARYIRPHRASLALADHTYSGGREVSPIASSTADDKDDNNVICDEDSVSMSSFNQGYYERFFMEERKLGKGLRGSVFSCQHVLDGVYLGHYAVKKVAVGNNHQWLKRMLREVKLLETLRHPNVVEYKHSWLEMHQLTNFGPKVPCLFILMEYANGGNLQEYMEPKETGSVLDSNMSAKQRILKMRRQQRNQGNETGDSNGSRVLSISQIWSFFADICNGLAHLHQLQIIHRDLKHMNLLLHWKDPANKDTGEEIPRIMLTDFGECEILSHIEKRDRTGATGTMEFMAPELLEVDDTGRFLDSYSTKSDMWSLGMVLYYLCYSGLPFTNIDDIDILRDDVLSLKHINLANIKRPKADAPAIPTELRSIIRLLLNHNENKRPDVSDVIHYVNKHKHMWHNLYEEDASRFEFHDSEAGSTDGHNTPRISTPQPQFPVTLANSVVGLPSKLQQSSFNVVDSPQPEHPNTAITTTNKNPINSGASTPMTNIFRRHSTGGSAIPPRSNSSDSSSLYGLPASKSSSHDSATSGSAKRQLSDIVTENTATGNDSIEEQTSKRYRKETAAAAINVEDGESLFYLKTALLVAKTYAMQHIYTTTAMANSNKQVEVAHHILLAMTLVLSAMDIHYGCSIRMSLLLLAANICIYVVYIKWTTTTH